MRASKTAVALRHVHFEDLGSFRAVLESAGYAVSYCDAGVDEVATIDSEIDLLVVLGGPIGANQEVAFPFLRDELSLIDRRLARRQPTLGICLGAQLMARALGARVYPGPAKEIGWTTIELTEAGRDSPLRHLGTDPVLHWHGDTFDLPQGARRLASTPICENQAFSVGTHAIAFQFHPEADGTLFERWLLGHAVEIAATDISVANLRVQTGRHAQTAARHGRRCLAEWLSMTGPAQ